MGFSNERKNSRWINFKDGKLIHNKTEHENFTGRLVDIDIDLAEFEGEEYERLVLYIMDSDLDNPVYKLAFPLESGYGNSLCSMMPNFDPAKDVTISGNMEQKDGGKKRTRIFLEQDGKSLKWKWTKENPGECPPPKEIKKGKKVEYDFTERNKFFRDLVFRFREFVVKANPGIDIDKKQTKADKQEGFKPVVEGDGLPF